MRGTALMPEKPPEEAHRSVSHAVVMNMRVADTVRRERSLESFFLPCPRSLIQSRIDAHRPSLGRS
jgi:hypothetical protein